MTHALVGFIHEPFVFEVGEEVPDDHPMVALRPDLFEPLPDPVLPPPVVDAPEDDHEDESPPQDPTEDPTEGA